MRDSPRMCSVPGCGRPYRARSYCQGHYKQFKTKGWVRPFPPKRSPRANTVKLGSVSVSCHCADELRRCKVERGCTLTAVITDELEAWYRRREEGRPLPEDP